MADHTFRTIGELIDDAMGDYDEDENKVNFKTIHTILHILAKQLRLLERTVEYHGARHMAKDVHRAGKLVVTEVKVRTKVPKKKKRSEEETDGQATFKDKTSRDGTRSSKSSRKKGYGKGAGRGYDSDEEDLSSELSYTSQSEKSRKEYSKREYEKSTSKGRSDERDSSKLPRDQPTSKGRKGPSIGRLHRSASQISPTDETRYEDDKKGKKSQKPGEKRGKDAMAKRTESSDDTHVRRKAPKTDTDTQQENILVVERLPSSELGEEKSKTKKSGKAASGSPIDEASRLSLATMEEFLEFEKLVKELAARLMGIPSSDFGAIDELLLNLRKNASPTDAMAALQLAARLEAAEQALKNMTNIITEIARTSAAGGIGGAQAGTHGGKGGIHGGVGGAHGGVGGAHGGVGGAHGGVGGTHGGVGGAHGGVGGYQGGVGSAHGGVGGIHGGVGGTQGGVGGTQGGVGGTQGGIGGTRGGKGGTQGGIDGTQGGKGGIQGGAGGIQGGIGGTQGGTGGTQGGLSGTHGGIQGGMGGTDGRQSGAHVANQSDLEPEGPSHLGIITESDSVQRFTTPGGGNKLVTAQKFKEAMNNFKEDLTKNAGNTNRRLNEMVKSATSLANNLDNKAKTIVKLRDEIQNLENVFDEYSEQINDLDTKLSLQITDIQDTLTQMEYDLEVNLDNMAEAMANASGDPAAVAEMNTKFTILEFDFDAITTDQKELHRNENKLLVEMEAMRAQLNIMKNSKCDRDEITVALEDKAGLSALNGLVTLTHFDAVRGDFEKQIGTSYNKFNSQEIIWQQMIDEYTKELLEKADATQLEALNANINKHMQHLNTKMKTLSDIVGEQRISPANRRVYRDKPCISCSTPEDIELAEKDVMKLENDSNRPPADGAEASTKFEQEHHHRCYIGEPIPHDLQSRAFICRRYCGGTPKPTAVMALQSSSVFNVEPALNKADKKIVKVPCVPCNIKSINVTVNKPQPENNLTLTEDTEMINDNVLSSGNEIPSSDLLLSVDNNNVLPEDNLATIPEENLAIIPEII